MPYQLNDTAFLLFEIIRYSTITLLTILELPSVIETKYTPA
jgi:hypothetical protein